MALSKNQEKLILETLAIDDKTWVPLTVDHAHTTKKGVHITLQKFDAKNDFVFNFTHRDQRVRIEIPVTLKKLHTEVEAKFQKLRQKKLDADKKIEDNNAENFLKILKKGV